jgi:tRNA1Val (adenine37-N6)-methyltransferase
MNDWKLNDGERLDDLVRDGMKIIQRPDQFCFSLDSILLAHYVHIRPKDRIVDLGTGTGVVSLIMSSLGARHITALEINPVMVDLARRNVLGNHREDIIQVIECDYNKASELFPSGYFQSVVVNPPYREVGSGKASPIPGKALACHELGASLRDVFKASQYLLAYGGRLTMVHRADRLGDLIGIGREFHMEAKRLRFIYARVGHNASRVLIEWRYGGHPEAAIDPPLLIHNPDGSYTKEILDIYGKESHE